MGIILQILLQEMQPERLPGVLAAQDPGGGGQSPLRQVPGRDSGVLHLPPLGGGILLPQMPGALLQRLDVETVSAVSRR